MGQQPPLAACHALVSHIPFLKQKADVTKTLTATTNKFTSGARFKKMVDGVFDQVDVDNSGESCFACQNWLPNRTQPARGVCGRPAWC